MLAELAALLVSWRGVFPRHATWVRAVAVLLGLIVATGRRTVTASIAARGRRLAPWAADYLVFSRASWNVAGLFDGVVDAVLQTRERFCAPHRYLIVAVDDTSLSKTGKTIASARWLRDPLSPPFHINLRFGLRHVHLAALLPLHDHGMDPRAVSIAFTPAPTVKKPGKKATPEQVDDYKGAKKRQNLCQVAVQQFEHLRQHLNATGHQDLWVLAIGDGSYTNRNVLRNLPDKVEYLGRARSDMVLHSPAPAGTRKVYGDRLQTPNQVRQDPKIPWRTSQLFYAGQMRDVRFKEMENVQWKSGALGRRLRVFIIAPTPYRAPGNRRKQWYYRDPAYLLTTDLVTPAAELIQAYLGRWQIEVEHRDIKTGLGVGHAQVSSNDSVARLHPAHVAMWSMVKLAALRTFGLARTDNYPERPAWYPQQPGDRASVNDIVDALRAELPHYPQSGRPNLQLPPRLPPEAGKQQALLAAA